MPDESKYTKDPTEDIYRMLDEAGLNSATLMSVKKSHLKIVNEIRTKLAMSLRSYITQRDHHQFNAGVKKGKADVSTSDSRS